MELVELLITVQGVAEMPGVADRVAEHNKTVTDVLGVMQASEQLVAKTVEGCVEADWSTVCKAASENRRIQFDSWQSLLQAAKRRKSLLQQIQPAAESKYRAAIEASEKARAKASRALEKSGFGLETMPGFSLNPEAVKIKFAHQVAQNVDVREAAAAEDDAKEASLAALRALRKSDEVITRAADSLRAVVLQSIR
jgi:hypothetical protein